MALLRVIVAMTAVEDLELDSVDVSTTFLNEDIGAVIYMKVPEGLQGLVDQGIRPGRRRECDENH